MERGQGLDDEFTFIRGVNHCLIIGINNYGNGISPLNNCVRDAEAIQKVFTEIYDFNPENATVLLDEKASRGNILDHIRGFKKKVKPEDSLVITFSGHGVNIDDVGYWLPQDAVLARDYTFISTSEIVDRLDPIDCHHILLIIDACFSGSIFNRTRSDDFLIGGERHPSRLGLSASHSRETAIDGKEGEHSPFSTHLLFKLMHNRKPLSIGDLASYVKHQVNRDTKGNQSPTFRPLDVRGDRQGEFIFYPKHSNYRFDTVLELISSNKIEEAKSELKNYCRESVSIPENYPFLICRLKQKMSMEKSEANVNFEIEECARLMADYPGQSVLKDQMLQPILELLGKNEIRSALINLRNIYAKNDLVFLKIALFDFRFTTIEKLYTSQEIDYVQYEVFQTECIELLILFLKQLDQQKTPLQNQFNFLKERLLEEFEVRDVLLLLKDFWMTNHIDGEELFLIKMLIERDINNRNRITNGVIDSSTFKQEMRKIRAGLEHLITRIEQKKIDFYFYQPSEEETRMLSRSFLSNLKKRLLAGELKYTIGELKGKVKIDFLTLIESMYLNLEGQNESYQISMEDYYGDLGRIFLTIMEQYLILKEPESYQRILEYRKSMVITERGKQIETKSDAERIALIKKFIMQDEIDQAVAIFSGINMTKNQKFILAIITVRNNLNMEDSFFTIKDQELISIRKNRIRGDILELLAEVEDQLLKKSS